MWWIEGEIKITASIYVIKIYPIVDIETVLNQ